MVTARERVIDALERSRRVPVDLGSGCYGNHGIGAAPAPPRTGSGAATGPCTEPYQVLGQVDDDVLDALGVDVIGLSEDNTMFGFPAADWQPFTLNDGTPCSCPAGSTRRPPRWDSIPVSQG